MNIYITFGQVHAHHVNGKTFDKDSVAVIECDTHADGRKKAFAYFGEKFFTSYESLPDMEYFPRGLISVEGES